MHEAPADLRNERPEIRSNPKLPDIAASQVPERPHIRGKFIFVGDQKFWVRGVTYGTFRVNENGTDYPDPEGVDRDFAAIARHGLNAVRVYTIPPRWLLDTAATYGLRMMVGLPWEQHVAFLDRRATRDSIINRVRKGVKQCAGHPALLCYAVGNEIPAAVVRWYGARKIESFLAQLCKTAKHEDPAGLVTYVNFPTTEYLDLPFVDFTSFNVYLETKDSLSAYLARLQNLAGERPLLMAEIGLDSRRNGEARQAETLRWQVATSFEAGCVGSFVFAWSDEWYRDGQEVKDWDFGLTTRDRLPKLALEAVADVFSNPPIKQNGHWPRVSIVVCSHNGSATIGETLSHIEQLDYPNFEVIVVDDGSTDATADIASSYNVRLIRTPNQGLAAARNTGMDAGSGEIIAYIDDDAYPDQHWLSFLAIRFIGSAHAGIGGPNLAPPGEGLVADCVANAPGGPVHILLTDEIAEHIPGCNMAYRKDCLLEIGGFDPRFRVAGDDVDLCWRLQERGLTLGFSPAAVVWHHRRNSLARYLKQQRGYAKAEALLADKWPAKYNSAGHLSWNGRIYGKGAIQNLFRRQHVYYGTWGSALFQSVYEPPTGLLSSLPLMPEWYFLLAVLGGFCALGMTWPPLLWLVPLLVIALAATLIQAARGAAQATFQTAALPKPRLVIMKALVGCLHLVQPTARLLGRIQHRLGPWRWSGFIHEAAPLPSQQSFWTEHWQTLEARLAWIEEILRQGKAAVIRGGVFDRWDLSIRGGLFGSVRVLGMVEEHKAGAQMFRVSAWPKVPSVTIELGFLLAVLAAAAALDEAWIAALALAVTAIILSFYAYADCAIAMKIWRNCIASYQQLEALKDTGESRTKVS